MDNNASVLPAREIAITLMRSALALLDHVGDAEAAAGLQSAIDIADEEQAQIGRCRDDDETPTN